MFCFLSHSPSSIFFFFFFNDTATTEIYTLSLHDALPIFPSAPRGKADLKIRVRELPEARVARVAVPLPAAERHREDRKSTRLNSSHLVISYAVFCLKKKKETN